MLTPERLREFKENEVWRNVVEHIVMSIQDNLSILEDAEDLNEIKYHQGCIKALRYVLDIPEILLDQPMIRLEGD